MVRNPSYGLTPAIVELARLTTLLSANGTSQTKATFQLRTKAPYLEVELPDKASLWSAVLDDTPLKPQKRGGIRLIGLPPSPSGAARSLQLVFEAPVEKVTNGGRLKLAAPRLLYRAARAAKESQEIPLVNIEWTVSVPDGYEAVATDGTLEAKPICAPWRKTVTDWGVDTDDTLEVKPIKRPLPAPLAVAGTLYELGGGVRDLLGGGARIYKSSASLTVDESKSAGWEARRRATMQQRALATDLNGRVFSGMGFYEQTPESKAATGKGEGEAAKSDEKAEMQRKSPAAKEPPAEWDVDSALSGPPIPKPDVPAPPPPTVAAIRPPGADRFSINAANPFDAGNKPAPAALPQPPAPRVNVASSSGDGAGTGSGAASGDAPASPPPTGTGFLPDITSAEASVRETKPAPAKPADSRNSDYTVADSGGTLFFTHRTLSSKQGNLSGFRSLKIDVEPMGTDERQLLTFQSLGDHPQIGITLARRNRSEALDWGVALAVFLLGVALTGRPVRQKAALVLGLGLASALLPLAYDDVSMAWLCNGVFYAASLLVPYYLVAGLVRWIVQRLRGLAGRINGPASASLSAALVLAIVTLFAATVQAQPTDGGSPTAEHGEHMVPVALPDDALIVPYDVKSKTGVKEADHLLVPYDRYVELWNLANPDKKIDAHPAPLPYALSGANYSAALEGEETLNITGQMQISVLADGYVSVPLGLRGGVLARADLDGKPARLKVVTAGAGFSPETVRRSKMGKPAAAMDATLLVLQVSGKGSHKLELEARLKLAHVGGWRGTSGALPMAPAATVAFRVPQAQTEVRLGQAVGRRTLETKRPDEILETALGPGGALQLQWRPKVAEAEVDRGLTVDSAGLLDVQEDGLRMALRLSLQFRRSQRDAFTLSLPADYLVEKVAGNNVRGWEVKRAAAEQTVEVSLLKTAKNSEQFNLFLFRGGKVGQAPLDAFAVPMVIVRDAALSSGQLTIRRSSLLDVRTTERAGVTRTDLGPLPDLSGGPATEKSDVAIQPYEAYRFPTMPFVLRLSAAPVVAEVTAEAQTSVKLDPIEPGLESKIIFHVGQRKIYQFEIAVPDDLRLPEVVLPSGGIWAIEKEGPRAAPPLPQGVGDGGGRSILKIHLQQGALGDWAVILHGKLARSAGFGPAQQGLDAQQEISLPRLEVLGVKRQEGDIAVQAAPAFNVQARELRDCQETELQRVAGWLDPEFRAATRLALHYSGGAYAGKLRLAPRTPEVVCDTITNVRVTDRAIEETIFLNYGIRNAGIHELTFLLPASMADARISTPLLRRRTIVAVDPKTAGSPLRVRLELQGDTMNDLRVMVQNDRLLTPGPQAAPLPGFETAAGGTSVVRHQYAVLETNNRDELVVEPAGLDALSRQQQQWQTLSELLGSKQLYQAYLVQPGAANPRLNFHLQRLEDVETAGARIDLAQTTIVVDANGAYRAKVELTLDNSSEQFLNVELPPGAALWTAHVAGEPVKPARRRARAIPGTCCCRCGRR